MEIGNTPSASAERVLWAYDGYVAYDAKKREVPFCEFWLQVPYTNYFPPLLITTNGAPLRVAWGDLLSLGGTRTYKKPALYKE